MTILGKDGHGNTQRNGVKGSIEGCSGPRIYQQDSAARISVGKFLKRAKGRDKKKGRIKIIFSKSKTGC